MVEEIKKPRGLAALSKERRKAISSLGGKAVPKEKRAFAANKALAAESGKKGGLKARPEKRAFTIDKTLASKAGKLGALARAEAKAKRLASSQV